MDSYFYEQKWIYGAFPKFLSISVHFKTREKGLTRVAADCAMAADVVLAWATHGADEASTWQQLKNEMVGSIWAVGSGVDGGD